MSTGKGWKHSQDAKRKIAEFQKGRVRSEETRAKMSKARKLRAVNPMSGKKHSIATLEKMSKAAKLRKSNWLGKHHSEASKSNLRKKALASGAKPSFKGRNHSKETKELLREKRLSQTFLNANTSIERKVAAQLSNLRINYVQQFRVDKWLFDFYLSDINLLIETDGDYWHSLPKMIISDAIKERAALDLGFFVLRLKEGDINKDSFNILEVIDKFMRKK